MRNLISLKKLPIGLAASTLILLAVILLLLACGQTTNSVVPAANPTKPTDSAAPNLNRQWLAKKPCAVPCFENITPGVTTITEVLSILQKNPQVTDINIDTDEDIKYTAAVDSTTVNSLAWNWNKPTLKGSIEIQANFSHKVEYLYFKPEATTYTMADILAAYGEPSHVFALHNTNPQIRDIYIFDLVYLNYGFIAEFYYNKFEDLNNRPILNQQLKFANIRFFVADPEIFKQMLGNMFKYVVEWQGYQDYSFYCRDVYGSAKACNN